MSDHRSENPPWWFWAITAFLLVWGLAYAWLTFFSFVLADASDWATMVANGRILPEYVDYIARIPAWAIALTALAALTRLGGALALVLRKRWAVWLYTVSLTCVAIIMLRGFVFADVIRVIRTSQVGVEILFMALSIFAAGFAYRMSQSAVLK